MESTNEVKIDENTGWGLPAWIAHPPTMGPEEARAVCKGIGDTTIEYFAWCVPFMTDNLIPLGKWLAMHAVDQMEEGNVQMPDEDQEAVRAVAERLLGYQPGDRPGGFWLFRKEDPSGDVRLAQAIWTLICEKNDWPEKTDEGASPTRS